MYMTLVKKKKMKRKRKDHLNYYKSANNQSWCNNLGSWIRSNLFFLSFKIHQLLLRGLAALAWESPSTPCRSFYSCKRFFSYIYICPSKCAYFLLLYFLVSLPLQSRLRASAAVKQWTSVSYVPLVSSVYCERVGTLAFALAVLLEWYLSCRSGSRLVPVVFDRSP